MTRPDDEPVHTPRLPPAVLLVAAALLQLLGQLLLRLPSARGPGAAGDAGSGTWVLAHVVLALAAVTLLAALVLVARLAGLGPLTWLGLVMHAVGQALTLAVLGIDLGLGSAPADVIRALDTWDFLAVAGAVVLLLELRRRGGVGPGVDLALIAVAVPAVEGLVVVAAGAVVVGLGALAIDLVRERRPRSYTWLTVVTVVAYAVAGTVSWQRAALAVVVLAWTAVAFRAQRSAAGS
ncbi:hypothetical protein EUA06_15820 [Nocardioides glacieisoli]|uniref:Uncharacterized protein n=1 Tax=Nocardioides glacieisoli TaxID=1168730 RepID=A0A4Q2RKZ7_9ACTN|nr:hypothetical protein [Nocardioides glacieisoli]RYB89440.1 hypothetical protein EUA06_15820 [Nocardioides glacieisoli]